ncbi:hypothetical protein ACRRS0_11775 [Agarivorans sp. QJM3NY_29]|uniref:hypothetical protein n=1 Tax=unclassified Agarivorans TaxID=2636026 RepID=UPI003D7F1705
MEKLSNWMIILGRKVVPASAGSAFFCLKNGLTPDDPKESIEPILVKICRSDGKIYHNMQE